EGGIPHLLGMAVDAAVRDVHVAPELLLFRIRLQLGRRLYSRHHRLGHQHQQADGAGHDRERTEREQRDARHGRTSPARSDRLATTASASRVYSTGWASWKGGRSRCSARGFRTISQKWYA